MHNVAAKQMTGSRLSVSLCSGAGGLDIGLEKAGWSTLAQVEMDKDCVDTLRATAARRGSRPTIIHARLEDVDPVRLMATLGLRKGELSLLAGGPPCQPFTTHGLRLGVNDARASSVFPSYLGFVRAFRPAAAVMENVDGLLSAALVHRPLIGRTKDKPLVEDEVKGSFLKKLVEEFVDLGYAVSWGLVEASDHGVPQYRQRALLIAVRGTEPCYLPDPRPDHPRPTVRDAIAGLPSIGHVQPLSDRKKAIYAQIPTGGNWRSLSVDQQRATMGAAFHATGGKSGWWRRLGWDAPSPTILGMPDHSSTGLIHPDEVRCLGHAECAALQTFPADMTFAGTPRSQYQQIGNAVPPLLGEAIGRHVSSYLDGEEMNRPISPPWRRTSGNRRIGTHGWATSTTAGVATTMNVKVREDHVWAAHVGIRSGHVDPTGGRRHVTA